MRNDVLKSFTCRSSVSDPIRRLPEALSSLTRHSNPCTGLNINDLPTELLAQILLFTFTCRRRDLEDFFGMDSITELRSVCVRWNETVLREPAFWTHIGENDVLEYSSAVEDKVQRSGALPLTIRYRNFEELPDDADEPPERSEFSKFVEAIGHCTHRWKRLTLYAFDSELKEVLRCLEENRLPKLEELEIRTSPYTTPPLDWTLYGVPNLRRLVLDGSMLPWGSSVLHSLVRLEIEGAIIMLDLLIDIIQRSRNLEELVLSELQFDEDDLEDDLACQTDDSTPALLSQLKSINIAGYHGQSAPAVACVLKRVYAPNIRNVHISEHRDYQVHGGRQVIEALALHLGGQSVLPSMLRRASNRALLELGGFRERTYVGLRDPVNDLHYDSYLALSEEDWEDTLVMVAAVARGPNVPVLLRFGWQPLRHLVVALSLFPSTRELDLVHRYTPLEDVLQLFTLLSHPLDVGKSEGTWICPKLTKLSLSGGRSEGELAVLRREVAMLKRSRTDVNVQKSRTDSSTSTDEPLQIVELLVGGLEL